MRLRQIESLSGIITLLMALATFCSGAEATANSCEYARSGTGMGGTGMIARDTGTGMGGTGISPEAATGATQLAGNVVLTQGGATAQHDGNTRTLAQGDAVCVGETIVTSQSGIVQMRMTDSAFIAVRPNTQLKIEKYEYRGTSKDQSLLALLQGTGRFITGNIGRTYPQNDLISTPSAMIGVRGTDHEATVILPNDQSGYSSGTYDKVNSGITFIRTAKGEIDIHPNQVGFAAVNQELPILLKDVPDFEHTESSRQKEDAVFHEGNAKDESGEINKAEQSRETASEGANHENPAVVVPSIEHPTIEHGIDLPDPIKIPDTPVVPDMPIVPEVPTIPEMPVVPEVPAVPETPTIPEVPTVPVAPEMPSVPDSSG